MPGLVSEGSHHLAPVCLSDLAPMKTNSLNTLFSRQDSIQSPECARLLHAMSRMPFPLTWQSKYLSRLYSSAISLSRTSVSLPLYFYHQAQQNWALPLRPHCLQPAPELGHQPDLTILICGLVHFPVSLGALSGPRPSLPNSSLY